MNKKILVLIIIIAPVLMMGKLPDILSFGAPVSSSGAPDEVTCANTGCHDNFTANTGNAHLSLSIGNNLSEYVPGQTYPVTVTISETGINRFGFQLVAIKNNDSLNAGELIVTDTVRTQLITNLIALTDRKYITYTYAGTEPYSSGLGQWTFNWTAPLQDVGPVTLYVGAVSANNDHTDGGDHVYTSSKTLTPDLSSAIKQFDESEIVLSLFPNPVSNQLNIKFNNNPLSLVQCRLYDIQGKVIKTLFEEKVSSVTKTIDMDVPPGIYFVKFNTDGKEKVEKIVVQ